MPRWAVQPYLDRSYVTDRPIGKRGLQSALHAATTEAAAASLWMADFLDLIRQVSFATLSGISPF